MSYGFHYFKGEKLSRLYRLQKHVLGLVKNLEWDDNKIDVSRDWVIIAF